MIVVETRKSDVTGDNSRDGLLAYGTLLASLYAELSARV